MNHGLKGFPVYSGFKNGLNGFSKKRTVSESFFGFPKNMDAYDFLVNATTNTFAATINIIGPVGGIITIDKGDGSILKVKLDGQSQNITLTYGGIGKYKVNIFGDTLSLTRFNFNNSGLTGYLSQGTIDKFLNVEELQIVGGTITGILPNFSKHGRLKKLWVYGQKFFGEIPSFNECALLEEIRLNIGVNSNTFIGPIPSFSSCLNLNYFDCAFTTVSGELPSFNGNVNLVTFNVGSCPGLVGELPSFSNCVLLQKLNIANCKFNGALPSFSACVKLKECLINNCLFSGTLPSFNSSINLTTFNCSVNSFAGDLPNFNNCSNIAEFRVNNNLFTGSLNIPPSSKNNIYMTYGDNLFDSPSPDFSVITGSLNSLYIQNSKITGTLILPSNSTLDQFYGHTNAGLTNIMWGANSKYLSAFAFFFSNCALNIVFPIGTKIITPILILENNSMSQASVDGTIDNLFLNRNTIQVYYASNSKSLTIHGNNAAPSGTYQQPSGFTHDLTEVELDALTTSVKEKIWILVNCQVSSVDTTKRYKWTITTN